jgi:hypothetical protein
MECHAAALALAEALGMRPLAAHCHLGLGAVYARLGDAGHRREHLERAVWTYRELGMSSWQARAEQARSRTP